MSTVAPFPAELMPKSAALIPIEHYEAFSDLTAEEQQRVHILVHLLQLMEGAPEGKLACSQRLALEIGQRGYSAKNLQALYQSWRKAKKDWRVLVRNYRGPSALPVEFVEHVRREIERNSRVASQALAELKARWAAGEEIPGFGSWRDYYRTEFPERDVPDFYPLGFFPKGWSRTNLYRKQSPLSQRTLKRRGLAAAHRYLVHMQRDLSKLGFLELIAIDDFETDILVLARHPQTSAYEICTCTGLLAIDAATRTIVGFGLKPRFKSDDGKRMGITRSDVQGLLYGVFKDHGIPADHRCTVLCENAAAAITPEFELALQNLLGVQVSRTGLIHDKTLKNGFVQSGGKPWEKGLIESTFNLMHNMAGAMPGQKGASYQLKPADLEAKILYAEKLIGLAEDALTPEVASQLRVPFLKFEEALEGYTRIFRAMEHRTKHQLQGFSEIVDFLLPDRSQIVTEDKLLLLSVPEVQACQPMPRMESPAERKAKLTAGAQFRKVPEHALALLLLTPKQVELRNHKISFAHGAAGYTFADADSPVLSLPEGTKLLGYFEGAEARELHCTDLQGRYVGSVKRRGRVDIRDYAAISAEAGEITRLITKHVLNPVRVRHEGENAQLAADDAHNRALLTAAGVPAENLPARLQEKISPPVAARTANDPSIRSASEAAPVATLSSPSTLSQKLARPLARDAFAAHQARREELLRGIAAEGHRIEGDAAHARAVRAEAESLTAEDRESFLADTPAETPSPAPAPAATEKESLRDYL